MEIQQLIGKQLDFSKDFLSTQLTKLTDLISTSKTTHNLLGIVVALIVLQKTHKKLNQLTLNNWASNGKFQPHKEIALLTGGCGGIGVHITAGLVKQGVKVIVVDVVDPRESLPANAFFYKADITSTKSVRDLGVRLRKEHGDPTILIQNAGLGYAHTILDAPEEKIRAIFEVNAISHFRIAREFLPSMIERNHGHVVTVASTASFVTLGEMVDYACTKSSALAFHEGLNQELRHWYQAPSIRTSIIHPIFVQTPMIKHYVNSGLKKRQPLLQPEDVANAIVRQIVSQNSGQIILPRWVNAYRLLRFFPPWLQEPLRGMGSKELRDIHHGAEKP